jgi:hypothetical protein
MDVTFFLTKFRVLAVDENGYAHGPKRILYLIVVDEKPFPSRRIGD